MSGTADIGMVVFAKAVVPVFPDAVKATCVELLVKLVTVAVLVSVEVQPVPQLPVMVDATLNTTLSDRLIEPLVPVTVIAVI